MNAQIQPNNLDSTSFNEGKSKIRGLFLLKKQHQNSRYDSPVILVTIFPDIQAP